MSTGCQKAKKTDQRTDRKIDRQEDRQSAGQTDRMTVLQNDRIAGLTFESVSDSKEEHGGTRPWYRKTGGGR